MSIDRDLECLAIDVAARAGTEVFTKATVLIEVEPAMDLCMRLIGAAARLRRLTTTAIVALALLEAPGPAGAADDPLKSCEPVYRLYRTWADDPSKHLHVATFDACEEGTDYLTRAPYNEANCEIVRALFQSQPGVRAQFWCQRNQ